MSGDNIALFRRGATRLIALHGGWNTRSQRAVFWLASRHNIPASEVSKVLALEGLHTHGHHAALPQIRTSGARHAGDGAGYYTPPSSQQYSLPAKSRSTKTIQVSLVISLISLVLTTGAAIILLPGLQRRSPAAPVDQTPGTSSSTNQIVNSPANSSGDDPNTGASIPIENTDIVPTEPVPSSINLQQEPEQILSQFDLVFNSSSARWPEMPDASRRTVRTRLIEALTVLLNHTSTAEPSLGILEAALSPLVIESVTSGGVNAQQITAGVWAADVLCGLDTRRRLPAWAAQRVSALLVPVAGPARSSESCDGAGGAIRLAAASIRTPADVPGGTADARRAVEAWSRWIVAAEASAGSDASRKSALLLAGLSELIRRAPDPQQSTTTIEAVRGVVRSLGWREESLERVWLLRAFTDPQISSDDLFTLTASLASLSSAPGVDPTMVLGRSADETARRALARRYSDAWAMTDAMSLSAFAPIWSTAARDVLSHDPLGSLDSLLHAAKLGAMNASISAAARGEEELADEMLIQGRTPYTPSLTNDALLPRFDPVLDSTSGAWGMAFLAAERDLNEQVRMLDNTPSQLDLLDARVLVEAAYRGSNGSIRRVAVEVVRQKGYQPAIINAVLEALPMMPRTPFISSLVSDLTSTPQVAVADSNWQLKLRVALVERMNEMLGNQAQGPLIDETAGELARTYAVRSGAPRPADQADPLVECGRHLDQWRERAQGLGGVETASTINDIEAMLARRLGLARSSLQRLVAHQRAIAELMVTVISGELPGRADRASQALQAAERETDSADHIFHQVARLEGLMVELWQIRVEEDQ